jgi:organic radical activating enzyme
MAGAVTLPPLHTMATRPLRIAEVFGPTIQGEGPSTGRRAMFVRLSGCNLDCRWCDTPYTWDWTGKNGTAFDRDTESFSCDVDHLAVSVLEAGVALVVITGGEPLVQRSGLIRLCAQLAAGGAHVEVETNGTIALPDPVDGVTYNVSPKLAHSGVDPAKAIRPAVLHQLADRPDAILKFVCADAADITEAADLVEAVGVPLDRAWVMPEGRSAADVHARLAALADPTIDAGMNLSPRLHVTCWEDERAR